MKSKLLLKTFLFIHFLGFSSLFAQNQTYRLSTTTYNPSNIINYTTAASGASCKNYTSSMSLSGQVTFSGPLAPNLTDHPVSAISWNFSDGLNILTPQNSYLANTTRVTTNSLGDLTKLEITVQQWQSTATGVNAYKNQLYINVEGSTTLYNATLCHTCVSSPAFCNGSYYDAFTSRVTAIPPISYLSVNTNLSNIVLTSVATGETSTPPNFSPSTTSYSVNVPFSMSSITVTSTAQQANATITVNGRSATSGVASSPVILNQGANTIKIGVTAQDGVTKKEYTLTVNRASPSSDANLSALALSNSASLNTTFSSANTSYTATVPFATSSIAVIPTVNQSAASIQVNGRSVASASSSGTIALNVGSNTINVVVTAEDGTTKKTYTITVTRQAPSTDASLSALSLNNGAVLSPSFNAAVNSYTSNVLFAVSKIKVTPTANVSASTIRVNGVSVANGTASGDIALGIGATTINVVVTAENGTTTQAYSIVVTRQPASANADLSNVTLNNNASISPAFLSATTTYASTVAYSISRIRVTPTSSDATASITVNGLAVSSGVASQEIVLSTPINTATVTAITVAVTAQSGAKKTYTINVTRQAPSTDATLSALTINNGAVIDPVFNSANYSYTSSVLFAVTRIKITPTTTSSTSKIRVNGNSVTSGSASGDLFLNVGTNNINVVVTAEDGATTKTYSIVLTRQPASNNASLANLTLNNSAVLSPVFSSGNLGYTSSVAFAVSSIRVTPTLDDATASVSVNNSNVASGAASSPITLNVGNNTINIVVTAQDGSTRRVYTITVTRAAASTNADLQNLSIDQGTLSPVFGKNTLIYGATISNSISVLKITPVLDAATSSIKINGQTATNNQQYNVNLNFGDNPINIVVTAENGSTTKAYTLTATRSLSADANLSSLSLSSGTLSPTFSSATTSYTASVPFATASITVSAVKAQSNAIVKVTGTAVSGSKLVALNVGANVIPVEVTAQNGTTIKTYTITVTRGAASSVATLSGIGLSSGTLSPVFATNTVLYNVVSQMPTIKVTPSFSDATASVKVNGVNVANNTASNSIPLSMGVPVNITILVTAQDGITNNTYTLAVTYTPPVCTPQESTINANGKTYKLLKFSTVGQCEWIAPAGVTKIDYLIVGGGGGSAGTPTSGSNGIYIGGGGGGGGGVLQANDYSITPGQSYNIKIGAGGAGGLRSSDANLRKAKQGESSQFGSLVAYGGGAGGGKNEAGGAGASGGGGGGAGFILGYFGGSRILNQGNTGGMSSVSADIVFPDKAAGGGGGGAGAAGANAANQKTGGNGGAGVQSSITGSATFYGGGGGGGARDQQCLFWSDCEVTQGAGGNGGGGAGNRNGNANAGQNGFGGGAGGIGGDGAGAKGGDGIIYIRYELSPCLPEATTITGTINGDGTFTNNTNGTVYKVLKFTTLGTCSTWTAPEGVTSVDYLVVGGGGSGGTPGGSGGDDFWGTGGGGAGGFIEGTRTINSLTSYLITVGAGGVAPSSSSNSTSTGLNGGNSRFDDVVAIGGGGGGGGISANNGKGNDGGSGGGGGGEGNRLSGSGTGGQGNNGNISRQAATNRTAGGGGGGAGAVGQRGGGSDGHSSIGGKGGDGKTSSITGTAIVYAGGGGGGSRDNAGGTQGGGAGGSGGGGAGGVTGNPGNGTNGLGGGGGGRGADGRGGDGGSGVVILRYAVSTNANLSSLLSSAGSLNPVFNANTLTYTINVSSTVDKINFTPTSQHSEALISINGEAVERGQASSDFELVVGDNNFSIQVIAPDGRTKKTYAVVVHRISSNTSLLSLDLTEGALSPSFDSTVFSYTAVVPITVQSIKVIPVVADAGSTIKVNGSSVANNQESGAINLSLGQTSITVQVTAEDGVTTKDYIVNVTRMSVDLSALSLSSGSLSQTFASNITSYTASVPNSVSSLSVLPVGVDPASTISVNNIVTVSGQLSSTIALKVGQNDINVLVASQDGSSQKLYTIVVTRANPSVNADLSALTVSAGTISPAFSTGNVNYTLSLPFEAGNSSFTCTPVVADPNASVLVNGGPVVSGQASQNIALQVGINTVSVLVTAQDGITQRLYTVTVTRANPNADANLHGLTLSAGTIIPAFSSSILSYGATVSNATESITLTPTSNDPVSLISVNGASVSNGQASSNLLLNVGSNSIDVEVTAQDNSTKKVYAVVVTRSAPSANANLSSIGLSGGSLSPQFSSSTLAYTVSVPFLTSSFSVSPNLADANASITVNGVPVQNGQASSQIGLAVGSATVITIVVTAQDGVTQKIYTIDVTRENPSANANLSSLSISSGSLSPIFSGDVDAYTANVANAVTTLTLTPTLAIAGGTITVNGDIIASGQQSGAVSLAQGVTTITVKTTAQDGTTTKTYTIAITRFSPSSNADLSAIALSNGVLSPAFSASNLSYTVTVPNGISSITITPSLADATAIAIVNSETVLSGVASSANNLTVGANTITVSVTAQDGIAKKVYSIVVTRGNPANNADLSGLSLSQGAINEVFQSSVTAYTASVSHIYNTIKVLPIVADPNATVSVNGEPTVSGQLSSTVNLQSGVNNLVVEATAQDGTKKLYNVAVTRLTASSNADLSGLTISTGSVSPTFSSAITNYTSSVGNEVTSIKLTPIVSDPLSTITVNGVNVNSGQESGSINLSVGENVITIIVRAQDESFKTYILTISRTVPIWNGSQSADWNTASNWTPASVPTSGEGSSIIKISPTAANNLALSGDLVAGTIDFNGSGRKIILGNHSLTVRNIIGASAVSHFQTNGVGKLKAVIPQGVSFTYPVGILLNNIPVYLPITIKNNASQQEYYVSVSDGVFVNGGTSGVPAFSSTDPRIEVTWNIGNNATPSMVASPGVDLSFSWPVNIFSATTALMQQPRLYHHNGTSWTRLTGLPTFNLSAGTFSYTGYVGSFSPFTIGEQNSSLPVSWLSFSGKKVQQGSELNWSTSSEQNTKDFQVQHSINAQQWTAVGTLPAAGNSNTVRNYQYVHEGPFKNSMQHYYRILQRDLDGKFSYSKIIRIEYPEATTDVVLYPNPASDVLHVNLTERQELRLVNMQGVVVWKGVLPAGRHEIPVSNFAAGNYILQAGKGTYKVMIR